LINQTFVQCPGIGPKTDKKLKSLGLTSWEDCLSRPERLPFSEEKRKQFLQHLKQNLSALQSDDISHLVTSLPTREHWRILGTYFDRATYFDIETTGLSSYDSLITVIVAFFKGELHTFLFEENLDEFLELIEQSELLVAFNGNSFDVPFVEKAFNIPDIGCPFIDLRWICYHQGYKGGLKSIEQEMEIHRPSSIQSVDGLEAVSLFIDWQNGDMDAKERLIRYCQADVLSTYMVAGEIVKQSGISISEIDKADLFASI
jgi:uncharacterized protein